MMHIPKNRIKFEVYTRIFIVFAVLTFGVTLWVLTSDLEYLTDSISIKQYKSDSEHPMKTVELINAFPKEITVHYDDGETGLYLANLDPDEKLYISAAVGQALYVTDNNGWERLDYVVIQPDRKTYKFSPHETSLILHRQLNVDKRLDRHPLVVPLPFVVEALSTRFKSLSGRLLDLYFDTGSAEGIPQGRLHPGQETTACSYPGHKFYATIMGTDKRISQFTIVPGKNIYYIEDPEHPASPEILELAKKESKYGESYYNRTGVHWVHYYGPSGPRPPPILYMWPAKTIGDVHRVFTNEGYWSCNRTQVECQKDRNEMPLDLLVVSQTPRVFLIENFLNTVEANEIIRLASPNQHISSVGDGEAGAFESDTRTSTNAWIARHSNELINSLYIRAANVLQIDEKLLTRNHNAEDIQVVHYKKGQKYDAHHDWGVSGYPESRYITLLLYLTDMADATAGGETSFPKAFHGKHGEAFKVQPKKGNAVLFYNLLEDGNADELSLHAALPVHKGEKWLANFWVWDPKIK